MLQLANADTIWKEAMYVSLSKRKIEIGSMVLELNPKLWQELPARKQQTLMA